LAAQATIAIENARLFEDSTRRQAWLTTILDINKRIATNEDMASLLAQIGEEAVRLIGADGTILRLLHGDQLVAMGATPYCPTFADVPETRLGEGIVGRAALENRVYMVPDVQACPEITPYRKQRAAEAGINAMLCVPVRGPQHVMGVLSITSKHPRVFTADETMVLAAYAEQCAIAIEHARLLAAQATIASENAELYERVRQYAGELESQVAARTRELQETNQRLAAASRHKSAFLANMSHELRTPLNSIIGFSEVLLDEALGELTVEEQREFLGNILSSGRHLLTLINDILDLSKVEAGHMELCPEACAVAEVISDVLNTIQPLASRKQITVEEAIDPALPTLVADMGKVKQILYNLLSNAVKFTPEQGRIGVRATREHEEARFVVWDTGIGISPEDQRRIFEEFQQVEATAARQYEGTGLGLTLAQKFVELHGGRIWVESVPDQGSTFTFTLPLVEPAAVPMAEGAEPQERSGPLVSVEDDAQTRELLRFSLAREGF
jgi:signal transduction histidine kinase